ncbi:MAG: 6-bladed beta-propeller [Candidatus Aquicultorales bacterium]
MATTSSYQERKVRKRVIALILLLLLLALTSWLAYQYFVNKVLPLPNVGAVKAADEIIPPEYIFSIDGLPGNALKRPQDVLVHPNGRIYVADTENSRVAVFDRNGRFLSAFKNIGDGKTLNRPVYLAVNSKKQVYVADRKLGNIAVFDANGKFIKTLKPLKQLEQQEWKPMEMVFDKDDNLYVTNVYPEHEVQIYSPDGALKAKVGRTGQVKKATESPEVMGFPNGILIDEEKGEIFIADSNNGRIQIFNKKGKFVRILPTTGLPRGIVFDHKKRLLVVDTLGHTVVIYKKDDKKGEALTSFGASGWGTGQFQYPNGLDFSSSDRRIYITDRENHRVQVWVYGPEISADLARQIQPILNWWWVLPLLLLLWYLWSKRKKHVMHEDFLKAAIDTNKLPDVVKKLKRLHVTQEIMDKYKDHPIDEKRNFEDAIHVKTYFEDLIDEFMKEFKLAQPEATVLSASKKGRARIVLLAEDETLLDAADAVDVKNMNFGDFLEKYVDEE